MARVAAEPAACTEQAGRRRRAKRAALAGPTWPARTVAGWYGHCFTQVLSSQCGGARRACAASTNTRQQERKAHVVVAVVVGRTDLRCSTRVSHTAQRATLLPSLAHTAPRETGNGERGEAALWHKQSTRSHRVSVTRMVVSLSLSSRPDQPPTLRSYRLPAPWLRRRLLCRSLTRQDLTKCTLCKIRYYPCARHQVVIMYYHCRSLSHGSACSLWNRSDTSSIG